MNVPLILHTKFVKRFSEKFSHTIYYYYRSVPFIPHHCLLLLWSYTIYTITITITKVLSSYLHAVSRNKSIYSYFIVVGVDTTVSPKSASHAHHTHKRLYITLTRSHTTHARFCAARRLDPNTIYSLPTQSWHDPAAAHSAYTKSNSDTSIVFDVRLLFYHIHYMM